jgi:hypothetical protein
MRQPPGTSDEQHCNPIVRFAVVSERVKDPHKGRAAVSAALDRDAVKEHHLLENARDPPISLRQGI